MNIENVKINGDGWLVNGFLSVPNDPANRHYRLMQKWINDGNTPSPEFTPEEIASNEAAATNAAIAAELTALDLASIRSLREYVAARADAPQFIKDKESAAIIKRSELV